ncbi:glycosyltransferase family 25 protein [Vaginella massiliensis]|uniref:glycosyltransferase family 25 protein n=1 Tax=Vaginella massiliensis TaxID=1816680 RepID=UPI00375195AB
MKTKPNYQTYLINLDRATDRLKFMQNEFEKTGVSFERIAAVDAKTLDHNSYRIKNKYDRDLVPGEIGCYLSHIKTLEVFLASDYDFALIIEDDAVLQPNSKNIIEKALDNYPTLPTKHQWDVLKLANGKRRNIKVATLDETYFIGACGTSIPITTIAAIWTRKAAQKFLDKVNKPIATIRRPIDCDLQHPWEFDLRIYNLLPSLVDGAGAETQIQTNQNLKKAKLSKQVFYEVNRVFHKYTYLIKHHGFKKFYDSFIAKKTERVL